MLPTWRVTRRRWARRWTLLSAVGRDEAGRSLAALLKKEGVTARLQHDRSLVTTVKLRVIGRQQQLLRLDFEQSPGHEVLAATLRDYRTVLRRHDVVVLSDYGKGGLAHVKTMIAEARKMNVPVLVDPKGEDYRRYTGANAAHAQSRRVSTGCGETAQ